MSQNLIDCNDCTKCNGTKTMFSEYDYKRNEDFCYCERCGYTFECDHTPVVGNLPKTMETEGIGVGSIDTVEFYAADRTVKNPMDVEAFIKDVKALNPEMIKKATVSYKDAGIWFVKNVLTGETELWDTHRQKATEADGQKENI